MPPLGARPDPGLGPASVDRRGSASSRAGENSQAAVTPCTARSHLSRHLHEVSHLLLLFQSGVRNLEICGGQGGDTQLVTLREPWSCKCPSLDQACSWDRRPKDCQSFQEQGGTEKVQSLLYLLNKCLSSPRYVPNPVLDIGDTQESEPSPCPFESTVH